MEMGIAEAVANYLLQIKAIKLNPQKPFTWASGLRSPIYCDNRISLSHPAVRTFLKECLVKATTSFQSFDRVAGVATAGIPHGTLLADALNLPFLYIREKPKTHGRQNQIEGEIVPGTKILMVEDLISTGGSSLHAVHAAREADMEVVGVLALFTYGFASATSAFEKENCQLVTLSSYQVLLEVAKSLKYIGNEEFLILEDWAEDPKKWSDTFIKNNQN
ncbi:MAG: orotate phosphoribosyltransferase [Bacteroidota bacterium]